MKIKNEISPEEAKARSIKIAYNWLKVCLVISSIFVYIAFALLWEKKFKTEWFFGGYDTLLIGMLLYTVGIIVHTYILHKFNPIVWMVSASFCIVGVVLLAGIFTYIFGFITIILILLTALFNLKEFNKLKKEPQVIKEDQTNS